MRKWSISRKLGVSFGGLVACILVLGLVSLWAVSGLRGELEDMSSVTLRKAELSGSIEVASKAARGDVRAMMLGAALNHPQEFQKYKSSTEVAFSQLDANIEEIRPLLTDPRAQKDLSEIAATLPQWEQSVHEVTDLAAAGKLEAANKIRNEKQAPL